jgi:hypothetical protein
MTLQPSLTGLVVTSKVSYMVRMTVQEAGTAWVHHSPTAGGHGNANDSGRHPPRQDPAAA